MTVNSEQSRDYYPTNTPADFSVYLDGNINFSYEEYDVALMDITFSTVNIPNAPNWKTIFINLDLVEYQNVLGDHDYLLRLTNVKPRGRYQFQQF